MGVFSVDSIDMVKAQQDAAKGCALFGNLNPAQILAAKGADEAQISKTLCEQMKPFGGFILAPGCDLASTIPLENLQASGKKSLIIRRNILWLVLLCPATSILARGRWKI